MDLVQLDIQDEIIAGQIWRLQHAAYAVEAELIGFLAIPPLMDTIETIRTCGETFFGILSDDEIVAAIACEFEGTQVRISRMMVHPDYFRRGLARRLIQHVEKQYPNTDTFTVSTGSKNEPAIRLYESMGYTACREWMPVVGLMITEFSKPGLKGGTASNG